MSGVKEDYHKVSPAILQLEQLSRPLARSSSYFYQKRKTPLLPSLIVVIAGFGIVMSSDIDG